MGFIWLKAYMDGFVALQEHLATVPPIKSKGGFSLKRWFWVLFDSDGGQANNVLQYRGVLEHSVRTGIVSNTLVRVHPD